MKRQNPQGLLDNWRELQDLGIPLEPMRFRAGINSRALENGLLIRQHMSRFTNMICELSRGTIGYILDPIIVSTLPNTIITDWELNLPWEDPLFQWLSDGDETGQEYSFPGKHALQYPRGEVLNHRIREKRVLRRGEMLEGLLLGVGYAPIPKLFPHGCEISIDFTVHDQWGWSHPSQFCMWVCRDVDAAGRSSAKSPRKPLFFDCHDQERCSEPHRGEESGEGNRHKDGLIPTSG